MFYSPLRYPGGKNRLSKFISKVCIDNDATKHYIEPFAGGASVALFLLMENKVDRITINDFDRSIYAFWFSVLNNTTKLCKLIEKTPITIDEWEKQKRIQLKKNKISLLKLGFSTLFLNRTNFSGIINAGPLGGKKQSGKYTIGCRFNKNEIINRIKNISKKKHRINLYNLDALELIKLINSNNLSNHKTIFYFDPPYYLKGSTLYLNFYTDKDHKELSNAIKEIKNAKWVVSYDNTNEINKMYSWVKNKWFFNLKHFAHNLNKTRLNNFRVL
jgi:DNA adenine methylase